MNAKSRMGWVGGLFLATAAAWGILAMREPTASAQQKSAEPFANAVEQRLEMINQLKEMNALLKEQNALLKSGKLKVLVEKQ